ncbi:MAG: HEPN domain-containing protein [Chloroflexi bacterium]|nr:HEPN domain-containing protein [Chloroflexota bacterium]MBI3761724.1 HEPN domain-containing protein [Chloroflexota bacterium]
MFKAENDFDIAHRAMGRSENEPPITDAVCFHSQQCAEKYLKAVLQEEEQPIPRIHGLIALLEACIVLDVELETLREDLEGLEGYAVAVRYPGANPSAEFAERALKAATRVRSFIRAKLGLDHPPETQETESK